MDLLEGVTSVSLVNGVDTDVGLSNYKDLFKFNGLFFPKGKLNIGV